MTLPTVNFQRKDPAPPERGPKEQNQQKVSALIEDAGPSQRARIGFRPASASYEVRNPREGGHRRAWPE